MIKPFQVGSKEAYWNIGNMSLSEINAIFTSTAKQISAVAILRQYKWEVFKNERVV